MLSFVHMSLCWIIWIIIMHDNVLTSQYELFWRYGIRSLSSGAWKQMLALFLLTLCAWSTRSTLHHGVTLCLKHHLWIIFQTRWNQGVQTILWSHQEQKWVWVQVIYCDIGAETLDGCSQIAFQKRFPNESMTPRITWILWEDSARHTVNWAFLYLCM